MEDTKKNIEFQVVINLSPIYLDNFRHDGEINIFCAPNPKPRHYGARISDRRRACALLFLNDFIEQFPMINPGVPIKRAHTPHIEPLHPDHHTAADYLRQFDLLVLNFISRGNFVILSDYGITLRFTDGSGIKNLNLLTAILDITDSELKEDLLQSLMDSLGSKQTCTTRSLHLLFIPFSRTRFSTFSGLVFIFRQYVIALSPIYESQ
ncbi:putative protein YneK [Escherichia coli]|nr:putative protein YneK [Escherichia coli]